MQIVAANGTRLHVRIEGPEKGLPVLFANSLGTDFRVWDPLLPLLPPGLRILRYDKRGHGLSDLAEGPWGMAELVADAAALLDAFGLRQAVVVGLSIGGLIAQGLAAERPDLVRALVLCDTAARIGTEPMWDQRIAALREGGIGAISGMILERWFTRRFRAEEQDALALWRNMLVRTPLEGYIACCAAIRDTDLLESTSRLRLPTLAVAGDEDGSTPPDLVRETAALIPGSRFHVLRRCGHIPPVEAPEQLAAHLAEFLRENGLAGPQR